MMVCIHRRFLNSRGVFINSGEHPFSAQSLIKRQGARWNGPPSHPALLKIRVGAATRSTFLKALDQFSHILITMSVKGECWEIEYYLHVLILGLFLTACPSVKFQFKSFSVTNYQIISNKVLSTIIEHRYAMRP